MIAPHLGGVVREEPIDTDTTNTTEVSDSSANGQVKVGFYHTPKQFLSMATTVGHPMDTTDHSEAATTFALEFNLRYPAEVVRLERKKNLLFAKLLMAQTQREEQ